MYDSGTPPPAPSARPAIARIPPLIVIAIGILVLVHFVRMEIFSGRNNHDIILLFGFWPARFSAQFSELAAGSTLFLKYELTKYSSPFSYALLHENLVHLTMNCVWFMIFGTPLARRLGALRMMVLMSGGALAGAAAHFCVYPGDITPVIGASAVVSAFMGACARFVFQPRPALPSWSGPRDAMPRLTVLQSFIHPSSRMFIVIFLLINAFSAFFLPQLAWVAHLGGLAFGFLCFGWIDNARR